MSQVSSYSQNNGAGNVVRAGLNAIILALLTQSSGSVAPNEPSQFQFWLDTSGANDLLKIRNAANTAWITIAEFLPGDLVRLLSEGGAVTSTSAANIFTAIQKIKTASAVGEVNIASDLASGIAARLLLSGHNDVAAERILAQIDGDIESNAANNESARLLLKLVRGGVITEILRLGNGVQIGSPTGGLKGLGSINAESMFLNNVDILTAIADASKAAWQTTTFSASPQNLDLASFRSFDLTISTVDVTLNFQNPTTQIGRVGLIRLNNTSGGDRTITLSNANGVAIGGGFVTDGTVVVSNGTEKFLLFVVKSATLVYVFEFVGEGAAASGAGFSQAIQFNLTTGQSADPLLRLQPIADGETQRVVIHELGQTSSTAQRLLVRAATATAVLAPGVGSYITRGDFGNTGPTDNGIAIALFGADTADQAFGEFYVRRTNSTLWVHSDVSVVEFASAGADPESNSQATGTFKDDTFDRWVLDFVTGNPASGSKFTVYRDVL